MFNKSYFLFFYFFNILIIPFFFIGYNYQVLFYFSIIECALFATYIYKNEECISFSMLFWVVSHFFSLSYLFIPKDAKVFSLLSYYEKNIDERMYFFAVLFTFFCHFFFVIGYLINKKVNDSKLPSIGSCNMSLQFDYEKKRKIFYIVVGIGFIPKIFLVYKFFNLYTNGGYLAVIKYVPNGIFYYLSSLFDIGLLLLIGLNCAYNIKNKKIIFLFLCFQFIYLLTGRRGEAFCRILVLMIILFSKKGKILSLKNILLFTFAGCFFIVLLISLSQVRAYSNAEKRMEVLTDFIKKKDVLETVFYSACSEFGSAFLTLYYTMIDSMAHSYGLNYLVGNLTLLPAPGAVSNYVNKITVFKELISLKTNMGGSYIGEAYYAFGPFGCFIFSLFGYAIGYSSIKIRNELLKCKLSKSIYIIPVLSYLIWWIRDYFSPLYRPFFWTILIICIVRFCNVYLGVKKNESHP